jgi:hypothetical protein
MTVTRPNDIVIGVGVGLIKQAKLNLVGQEMKSGGRSCGSLGRSVGKIGSGWRALGK